MSLSVEPLSKLEALDRVLQVQCTPATAKCMQGKYFCCAEHCNVGGETQVLHVS